MSSFQSKRLPIAVIVLATVLLSGCASTIVPNGFGFARSAVCNGRNNTWNSCYAKAKQSCKNGYTVLNKRTEPQAMGSNGALGLIVSDLMNAAMFGTNGNRELIFTCNK